MQRDCRHGVPFPGQRLVVVQTLMLFSVDVAVTCFSMLESISTQHCDAGVIPTGTSLDEMCPKVAFNTCGSTRNVQNRFSIS